MSTNGKRLRPAIDEAEIVTTRMPGESMRDLGHRIDEQAANKYDFAFANHADEFVRTIEQCVAKGDGGADEKDTLELCAIIRKQAAELDECGHILGQIVCAGTLRLGESLLEPIRHAAVGVVLDTIRQRDEAILERDELRARLAKLESAAQDVADAYGRGCAASSHGDASDVRAAETATLQASGRLSELMRDEFPEEAIRRRETFLAKLKAAEKVEK